MTPAPVDPAAASGPVDRVAECEALRAELWSMTGRWEVACQLLGERTSLLDAVWALCDESDRLVQRKGYRDGCMGHLAAVDVRAALTSPPAPEAERLPAAYRRRLSRMTPEEFRQEREGRWAAPEPEADEIDDEMEARFQAARREANLRYSEQDPPAPVDQPVPPTEPGEQATCEHGEEQQ